MIPHLDRMNEPITAILSVKTLLNLFLNLTAGQKLFSPNYQLSFS